MENLTFEKYTGELIKKDAVQPKIINKGYRLLEDLKMYPSGMAKKLTKWIDEGLHNKMSQKEWSKMFDDEMELLAKKGDVFFRSKIFKDNDGLFYIYPNNSNPEKIFEKKDISFGLQLFYEKNQFNLWKNYLHGYSMSLLMCGKGSEKEIHEIFEKMETDELSFEQKYIVPIFNERKKQLENEIDERVSEIKNTIYPYIDLINYGK